MILSNETYQIIITKDMDSPLQFISERSYDHVYNPQGYTEKNFHAAFVITIQTGQDKTCIALIGSIYASPDQCAVLDGSNLTVLMDEEIVQIDLQSMQIAKLQIVSDTTLFSIYPIDEGYIIHGEMEILRLDSNYMRIWDFWGSDIFVTQDRTHEAFKMENNQILLEDWNGVRYALDMDGKLIWDTYK